jgi:DNA-binding CsgD family transcriptional regulator
VNENGLLFREPEPCEAARRLGRIAALSPREREVLGHAAFGDPNQEIAGHMHISERTVRHHFTVLFQKLGVRNRVDVAMTGLLVHVASCDECLRTVAAFRALDPGEPPAPAADGSRPDPRSFAAWDPRSR